MNLRRARTALMAGGVSLIVATLLGTGSVRAGADLDLLVCTAAGTVDIARATPAAGYDWTVSGTGSCAEGKATQVLAFTGTGTSDTLGLCDRSVLVRNLSINVTMTLTNVLTGEVRTLSHTWSLALTTFPLTTPFTIDNDTMGVGTVFSHIRLMCPPVGTGSAEFAWVQSPA
jgi:hypothetical protein